MKTQRVEIIEQRDIFNRAIFRIIEARLKYRHRPLVARVE